MTWRVVRGAAQRSMLLSRYRRRRVTLLRPAPCCRASALFFEWPGPRDYERRAVRRTDHHLDTRENVPRWHGLMTLSRGLTPALMLSRPCPKRGLPARDRYRLFRPPPDLIKRARAYSRLDVIDCASKRSCSPLHTPTNCARRESNAREAVGPCGAFPVRAWTVRSETFSPCLEADGAL